MSTRRAYVVKETAISAIINILIGAAFFIALFHGQTRVGLWGIGGIVIDCLPQGFMIGLMSVLPPSLITRSRIRKGLIEGNEGDVGSILLRGLISAGASMIGLCAVAATLAFVSGATNIPFAAALAVKSLSGGVIALLLTPRALSKLLAPAAATDWAPPRAER